MKGRASSAAGRVAVALTSHMHPRLLANPERVLINLGAVLLGVFAFLPSEGPSNGVLDQWPLWFQYEWGLGMVFGGMAALHGYWTGYRPTERVGAAAISFGCFIYVIQYVAEIFVAPDALRLPRGAISAIIFLAIGVAKLVRLLRSLAVTERYAQHLDRGDLDGGPG